MTQDAPRTQTHPNGNKPWKGDAEALAGKLRRKLEGEVRFDDGSRALYATDGSNYRQVPIGVVIPRHVEDVLHTVEICRDLGAPLLSRGGGTSLAGQCCNVAVVLDMSKYLNRVLDVDPDKKLARVQPGTVLDDLRKLTKKEYGLTFGPDPATHNHCTLGGMIGNNSCGIRSVLAAFEGGGARTSDNLAELEVLTYQGDRFRVGATSEDDLAGIIQAGGKRGEIYGRLKMLRDRYAPLIRERFPKIPRRVSGYNLDDLLPENHFQVARSLAGTEGTCVLTLEAVLHLVHNPKKDVVLVLGYPDVYSAGDHVTQIMEHRPMGLEGLDSELVSFMKKRGLHTENVKLLPEGKGWLVVEFGADTEEDAAAQARKVMALLEKDKQAPHMKLFTKEEEKEQIWAVRESGLGATAFVPGMDDAWPGWEDSAVPPAKVGNYLRDLRSLFKKFGYHAALYGHFGQGCIHCRIDFDLVSRPGLEKYRDFVGEASDLVVRYGGSLSGEHGDGQSRAELLPKMYGEELVQAFRDFKSIWDPDWKMNPGKVIDPAPILSHLRLGDNYEPWEPETFFQYPEDGGSFSRATLRCVGVGKCRRMEGGTMCPSYMVTREEMHATRGRAHLLFEMLQGDVITEGWKSEPIKEALDLCLACKGCKGDCPVNVDMATYKAEFLAHYYKGRLRPRHAYAMGLIYWWARLASVAPRLVNFFGHAPVFSQAVKFAGGISQERDLPLFAPRTFRKWFKKNHRHSPDNRRVLLWPDTFNNNFFPQVLQAAVEVLEAAGWDVLIPRKSLCCGRPLYDFGMLKLAKRLLQNILETLRPLIRQGVHVVVLEPSCLATFRDELTGLYPHDEDAKRLCQQSMTLSEFLEKKADYHPPTLAGKAIVHGHCHHKAIIGMDCEKCLLDKIGLDYDLLDSGCCGMAGAFGFEAGHYDVSVKCGERVLLPAVREAEDETLIIADGFSCREQIKQMSNREALHTAQVLQRALRQSGPRAAKPAAALDVDR